MNKIYDSKGVQLYQTVDGFEVWSNSGRTIFKCDCIRDAYHEYNRILGSM